jgi:cytochrome oxidase Cu insertion factor (SCO1/SenC/PrrC family)
VSRRSLTALLALAVVSFIALAALARDREGDEPTAIVERQEGPFRAGPLPDGLDRKPAPGFRLADARGGTLDSRALRGRPYLLTFLFTDCRDVCPLIGREIGQALHQLGSRAREVAAVAISVDPEGDTRPAVLPETFFIDARGRVVGHVIGAVSDPQRRAGIAAARSGKPVGPRSGGDRRPTR